MAAVHRQLAGVEVWVAVWAVEDAPVLASLLCRNILGLPAHGLDEALAAVLVQNKEESVRMGEFAVMLQHDMPQVTAEVIDFAANMQPCYDGPTLLLQQLSFMCKSDAQAVATVDSDNSSLSDQQMMQLFQSSRAWQVFACLKTGGLVSTAALRGSGELLRALAGLPHSEALSAGAIGNLLESAVQQGRLSVVTGLQHFPAFKHLDATFIGNLLLQTLPEQVDFTADVLADTPQAQQLPVELTVAALQVSLASLDWCSNTEHHKWLALRLPGLQQLNAVDLATVLKTALQHRPPLSDGPHDARGGLVPSANDNPFCMLLNHPAAAHIHPGQMFELVQIPLQQADFVYSAILLQHPAAQQLQSQQILQLIKEALNVIHARREIYEQTYGHAGPWFLVLTALCELPEAGEIATEDIEHLLTDPMPQRPVKFLLLRLSGARRLSLVFIERYITTAAAQHDSDLVEELLHLPAAEHISAEFLVTSIMDVLAADDRDTATVLIDDLLATPADIAVEVWEDYRYEFFRIFSFIVCQSQADKYQEHAHQGHQELLAKLCDSAMGLWLTEEQVGDLLKNALIIGHTWALEALLTLDKVPYLDASIVSELLALYLNLPGRALPDVRLFTYICSLRPAAKIGSAALHGLLETAIAKQGALMNACTSIHGTRSRDRKLLSIWDEVVRRLCQLSTRGDSITQRLGAAAIDTLLQHAIRQRNTAAIVRLCALPAEAELAVDVATNLVRTAMSARLCLADRQLPGSARQAIRALVGLQSMQQIDAPALRSLLVLAVGSSDGTEFLSVLSSLPAAQKLSRVDVAALMTIAAGRGDVQAMQRFKQL